MSGVFDRRHATIPACPERDAACARASEPAPATSTPIRASVRASAPKQIECRPWPNRRNWGGGLRPLADL